MAKADPVLSLGFAAVSWIEHYLVHGPGDVQGQRIEVDDEFFAFTVKAYRVDRYGRRRIRRAFLSRPKGRNKSGFAAMIECFEALGPCRFDHWAEPGEVSHWGYEYEPGEPVGAPLLYAEILNVATEEGQAGNTYDAVHYMLHPDSCSDELRFDYGLRAQDVGLTRIILPNKRGFIEPVTAANESKDGGKSTFIVADETHLWIPPTAGKFKLGKMHQTMVRNLLKRKIASGWMLETSTMYAEGEGSVAEGTHQYAEKLAKAGRRDDKLLFDHRQASDHWDLEKRSERIKALKEAYGPAAAWMDLQAIADYWDDPQASHAEFRRFWLNQPVPSVAPKPSVLPHWGDCRADRTRQPDIGALGVAVDLNLDWSSLGVAGRWKDDGRAHLGIPQDANGLVDHAPYVPSELAARVKHIQDKTGCLVVMDSKCPDTTFAGRLRGLGVKVHELDLDEMLEGTSTVILEVAEKKLTHAGNPDLDDTVKVVGKRTVGDRPLWDRKSGDITPVEAVTVARWGLDHDTAACKQCAAGPIELEGSLMA